MHSSLTQRRNRNHTTLQSDEKPLVLLDGVLPAAGHLGDAVGAAGEDREEGDGEAEGEEAEGSGLQGGCCGGGEGGWGSGEAGGVLEDEEGEGQEREDLPVGGV